MRVLLADDHQILRAGLRMILADAPPSPDDETIEVVGEASTGEEAVRLAAALHPDVVLMDVAMPGIDGIEATRRLRAAGGQPAGERPAVLILTTYGDDARVREAIQAGALGYLLKDLLRDDLVRAVYGAARGVPTLDPRAQQLLMRQLHAPAPASPFDALTGRERDVLRLIARGRSNKEIAAALSLSLGTVKGYVSAMLPKLGVGDRTQAALFATRHGLE
ncbi:DNA-binding response regulator [Roseisolibacter agri]|uniref:DNA-binding response regulator n=1 Tax=Roseisolibacter agri TaxID=2014610 RepID=A0AA37Q9K8_9BACT|nr:DNA-binding response regulator [Roseisolibacter agri]